MLWRLHFASRCLQNTCDNIEFIRATFRIGILHPEWIQSREFGTSAITEMAVAIAMQSRPSGDGKARTCHRLGSREAGFFWSAANDFFEEVRGSGAGGCGTNNEAQIRVAESRLRG